MESLHEIIKKKNWIKSSRPTSNNENGKTVGKILRDSKCLGNQLTVYEKIILLLCGNSS